MAALKTKIFLISATSPNGIKIERRIMGGSVASIKNFPFMVNDAILFIPYA